MFATAAMFRATGSAQIAVTDVSAATPLPGPNAGDTDCDLRLVNTGTGVVFVNLGTGAVTVTNDGTNLVVPVGPQPTWIRVRRGETHIAARCPAAGTATLYVSRGDAA